MTRDEVIHLIDDLHRRQLDKMGKYLGNMDSRGQISSEGNYYSGYLAGLNVALNLVKTIDAVSVPAWEREGGKMSETICPVCGERDPYPQWFCMSRAAGVAVNGAPCSYSLDGADRMKTRFADAFPARERGIL
jgi:hypothetical protein